MSSKVAAILLCCSVLLAGCSRQAPFAPSPTPVDVVTPVDLSGLSTLEASLVAPAAGDADNSLQSHVVALPAGSVDALAGALAQVGPHGTVILRSGLHRESGMIEITAPVLIVGETGAVLESAIPVWPTGNPVIQAALWVHNTPGVAIRGVELRPAGGLGGAAILLEGAPGTAVFLNNIHDFEYGVMVNASDRVNIWSNRIATTAAWQTDPAVPEAHGIVVIGGRNATVALNRVTNGLFGIWACDRGGLAIGNTASDCLVGLILCKVPAASYPLPSGVVAGAPSSAIGWLAQGNETFANFTTGLLVIDGANENRVVSNNSHDNGGYAVELTGDTYRFGFLTPASFNNVFIAGAWPHVQVKNCGNGNRIFGGNLVDNTLEPCN